MTKFLLPPGFRATDADDNPLSGGKYMFYAAATTTPKAVYSDAARSTSLGTTVNLNSAGAPVSGSNTPVLIYLNTGAYKVELYNSADTLIFTFDNIPGAEEEVVESATALPETPVESKTTAYTVTSNDRATLINANPTGGSFAITLPSAVTMGDDFRVGVRHNGSANQVSVVSSGSQFIRAHKALRSYSLTGMGETAWFVSDGSDWIVDGYHPPLWKGDGPYFRVLDRLTAPPANPDAGARYLINGAPTGLWNQLGFAQHDIAEADGNGSWIKHTPEPGWMAFDVDEEQSLVFRDSTWENFQVDPGTSTLGVFVVQDQKTSGSSGGTAATGAWTTSVLNTSIVNTIDGASLASNKITLPGSAENPRTYLISAAKTFLMTANSRIRFKTADDDSIIRWGVQARVGNYNSNSDQVSIASTVLNLFDVVTVSESTDFILEYRVSEEPGGSNAGLGNETSLASTPEVYATVSILDLTSLQGPKGDQGDQGNPGSQGTAGVTGPTGSTSFDYDGVSTTDSDPGDGKIRFNNADLALATEVYIDNENRGGVDISAWLDVFGDVGTSTLRGFLLVQKAASPTEDFRLYDVNGSVVDGTGYRKVTISHTAGGGSWTNADELIVTFVPGGPPGALELGSSLDLDGNDITGTGNIAITGNINATGDIEATGTIAQNGTPVALRDVTINDQSGTTYTLALTDGGCEVTMDNGSPNTLTIPAEASVAFPIGTQIAVRQLGAGVTTVDGDTGVTVNGVSGGGAAILDRYQGVALLKVGSDTWIMSGAHGTVA